MQLALTLQYLSAADLRGHLHEHQLRGALLVPLSEPPTELEQYAPVRLEVEVGERRCTLGAELLQVLPGAGMVVRLVEAEEAEALVADAPIADPPEPPLVRILSPSFAPDDLEPAGTSGRPDGAESPGGSDGSPAGGTQPRVGPRIAGSSPVSWSFEQLVATWDQLTVAEKVRVARHGKRPARMMILKGLDKTLHVHVLHNSGVTPEEVALMASMSNLDPTVLRRIASDSQWVRHSSIARNLICNPRLTLPQITQLLRHVGRDELSRIARTGKVRQSVKQLIVKRLDRTR